MQLFFQDFKLSPALKRRPPIRVRLHSRLRRVPGGNHPETRCLETIATDLRGHVVINESCTRLRTGRVNG